VLSTILYGALRAAGITTLARSAGTGGLILCYHNIVTREDAVGAPGLHLPIDEFAHQVRWLSRSYSIVSLREFADRLETGRSMRRIAAITFDDAYAGVFDNAWPLLRDAHVPATVFVPTNIARVARGFWWDHPEIVRRATEPKRWAWLTALMGDAELIEHAEVNGPSTPLPAPLRVASWERIIAAAAEGLDVGVHSASHRNLVCLSPEELAEETAGSRTALFARTGVLADGFAYPYGLFDARVRDAVRRAGFRIAVTLDFGLNRAPADPLALSRINVPASIRPPAFEAWAAGLRLRSST
jgi:peptidoglycan/xylan/chitin deacetylase (PgdA/CDA1 family)